MRLIVFVIVALVIAVGAVAVGYAVVWRAETVVQPIEFNHTLHLNEAGVQCIDCHTDAETATHAGLPGKEVCFDCHDIDEEEEDGHPEKKKLFAFVDESREIPWRRVAVTRPDVYFSHRRHVTSAKLDCVQCHADQAELAAPPTTARLVMAMDDCIECHEENKASSDCLVCHR